MHVGMQFATRLRTHAVLPRRQLSVIFVQLTLIFVQLTLIFVQLTLIFHPTPASRRRMRPAKRYHRPAKRYLRAAKPYLRCRHCRRQSARGLQKKELAPPSLHTLTSMETFVSGSNTHRIGMQRLGPLANATSEGDPVMQIKFGVGKINNACRVSGGPTVARGAGRRPRSASCALRPPACWGSLMLPNWQPAAGQRLASRFGAGCPPPWG